MKMIFPILTILISVQTYGLDLNLECNGEAIATIEPAILGVNLEDRIDRTCARVGEFESTTDLDKSQRLKEFFRLTKRLYPKEKYADCADQMADVFSAYLSYEISIVRANSAVNDLFGSSAPNSSSTSKGLCTNMLLDHYDPQL